MVIFSYLASSIILGLILAVIEFFIIQVHQGISKYSIIKWFKSIIILIILSFVSLNLKDIETLFNFNFVNIILPLIFVSVSYLVLFIVSRQKFNYTANRTMMSNSNVYLRILILALILVSFGYFREYIMNVCKSLLSGYC